MKPMLAFKFQDKQRHLTFPCHVQPKLNGIRMLYQSSVMQSRSHGRAEPKTWPEDRLSHIRSQLYSLSDSIVLDGELYRHGWSLQQINSCAAVNRINDTMQTSELEYHVFDCVLLFDLDASFEMRQRYLTEYLPIGASVKQVSTVVAPTLEDAERYFQHYRSLNYEGAMYRQSSSPYGIAEVCGNKENRWPCLLKRKDWLDAEFEIYDFVTTVGEKGETGFIITCKTPTGLSFNVGSGLSDLEVQRYADSPPLRRIATVKFEMYSDGGIPLKPTILEIN